MTHDPPRRGPVSALRAFLSSEAAGGIVLMIAAASALIWANSHAAGVYAALVHARLGPWSLVHWVNDGLMPIFFLLVGLEMKREWVDGQLQSWADRRLPFVAAASGMIVPALIYLAVTAERPDLSRGWAIPAATDIAFAIGVLALVGRRAPASLKLLLTTIAIADDMGAVAVIAVAYTADLHWIALAAGAAIWGGMVWLGRRGERRLWPFLVLATALWAAVLASGIHATIAGVLAALAIPIERSPAAPDAVASPLHRLEHALQPIVAFGIVPLFGFANAGVAIGGAVTTLTMAIAAGLFVGKQAGVFASIRAAVALGWAKRPAGASWAQLYGAALLCGVGFTMSLFIGSLAFGDPAHAAEIKLGVLGGSLLSGLAGGLVLRFSPRAPA